MNIKFIILLLLIPFFSGCFSWAPNITMLLSRSIKENNSDLREFKAEEYLGTIFYDSNTNTYYTDKLLEGGDRKLAISFSKIFSSTGEEYRIEEVSHFPNVILKEVPLRINTEEYWQQNDPDFLYNGIVVDIRYSRRLGKHLLIWKLVDDMVLPCEGNINVQLKIRKNTYNFKKMGYLITIPFDIVTFPFNFLYAITHIPG